MIPPRWRPWILKSIHLEMREIWILQSVSEDLELSKCNPHVQFSFGDRKSLEEIIADKELGIGVKSIPYYSALLRDRNRLVVGRNDGRIVFYGGVMCERRNLPRGYFLLEPDEFYIVACFTRADHRGRGIYPSALRFLCSHLSQEGYRRAYIDVATYNAPSLAGVEKAGAIHSDSGYQQIRLLSCEASMPYGSLSVRFVNTAGPFLCVSRLMKGGTPR